MNIVIENKFLEKNPSLKEVTRKTYVVNISKLMTLINSTDLDILYKDYEINYSCTFARSIVSLQN